MKDPNHDRVTMLKHLLKGNESAKIRAHLKLRGLATSKSEPITRIVHARILGRGVSSQTSQPASQRQQ